MDASKMGKRWSWMAKMKKTLLSPEEEQKIIDIFNEKKPEDDLSVVVKIWGYCREKLLIQCRTVFWNQDWIHRYFGGRIFRKDEWIRGKFEGIFEESKTGRGNFSNLKNLKYEKEFLRACPFNYGEFAIITFLKNLQYDEEKNSEIIVYQTSNGGDRTERRHWARNALGK